MVSINKMELLKHYIVDVIASDILCLLVNNLRQGRTYLYSDTIISYIDNKLEGLYISRYKNNGITIVKYVTNYKNNVRHGTSYALISYINYINDYKHGIEYQWYTNGILGSVTNYIYNDGGCV